MSTRGGWVNRLILGDSLVVMNSLLNYEGLGGQVQMIYIDPPYGVRFGSNFQPFVRKRDVKDGSDDDMTREPEMVKAYRDTWELGLHSYLTYLRDRLLLARDLLAPSGSVFVQIGTRMSTTSRNPGRVFWQRQLRRPDHFREDRRVHAPALGWSLGLLLLFYAKDRERLKYREVFREKTALSGEVAALTLVPELPDGTRRRDDGGRAQETPRSIPPKARRYRLDNLQSQSMGRAKGVRARRAGSRSSLTAKTWRPSQRSRWKTNEDRDGEAENRPPASSNGEGPLLRQILRRFLSHGHLGCLG